MTSKKSWTSFVFPLLVLVIISAKFICYFRKEKTNELVILDQVKAERNMTDIDGEHSRQKRFLFFTSNRKLALPTGTALSFSLLLNVNPLRNGPVGYSATLTLDYNFDIATDELGFTSDENPWFVLPFFYFNGGGPGDSDHVPGVNLAGGDRVVMFQVIEDIIETIGLLGKPCVQRAICEIFQGPLRDHGFLGEVLKLFFSASRAAYAEVRLADYLAAEKAGKETGDCSFYHQLCLHSLFSNVTVNPPKLIPVEDEVEGKEKKEELSRKKRFLYFTRERRIVFPPGSLFFFISSFSVPFRGNIPTGLGTPNLQVSVPLQLTLDDLGLTSEEHPFGLWSIFDDELDPEADIPRRRRHVRTKRSDSRFPGGDREMLYSIMEDAILTAGLEGKACLLRAICEMFQYPLDNHGFFGEFLELFFSASLAPDAEKRLPEYVAAERAGKTTGKCFAYHDDCPYSLFTNPMDSSIMDEEEMKKDFSEERRQEVERQPLLNPSNLVAVLIEYLERWL
ncbi:uncharacterized protein [Macrobrachium rosenbergii]|uniref:uncharacterized protein n=1 Tax=Macrobrachium rosenbergii TaxID=79674 RepID=UPI0034D76DBE